jgi:Outer membrane protein beta-barrel domain
MKSIKWFVLALMCSVAVPSAMGSALVTKGSRELALSGMVDFDTEAGTEFDLDIRYAYFFWDRTSVGLRTQMFNNDAVNAFGLGVTAEYNFTLPAKYRPLIGTDFVPYVGVALDYREAKLFDEKQSAGVFGGEAGVKFFLTDSTAITFSLVGELATEDIYADDLDATDKDLGIHLGMRFYF